MWFNGAPDYANIQLSNNKGKPMKYYQIIRLWKDVIRLKQATLLT